MNRLDTVGVRGQSPVKWKDRMLELIFEKEERWESGKA